MKTGHQIESDIYGMFKGSELLGHFNGGIYRKGLRPRDSKLEDMVILFVEGDGNQVQSGTVVVQVYVPDICPYGNGVKVENIARTEEVETLLDDFVNNELKAWRSNYKFQLVNAVHTQRNEEIGQSFVVARMRFQILN